MINEEKKYQEVLERAKKELDACDSLDCDAAKQIFRLFPELQSIKNEKIKNNIIKLLRFVRDNYHQYSDECKEAIDWLEKQDNKLICPKFKKAEENRVLDWVVKFDKDGKIIVSDIVYKGEYFIMLQSLKTLPKEE